MRANRFASFVLLISGMAVSLTGTSWGQGNIGTISGTVLDPKGNPLSGITVMVRGIGPGMNRNRQSVTSDAQGTFLAGGWSFGNYLVLAVDERPQQNGNVRTLPANRVLSTVMLSQTFPTASVRLQFGHRTARLMGQIRDAVTNQPVNARLDLTSASGDSWFAGGVPADCWVLIPRRTDLTVAISAPGYETWYYPAGGQQSGPLNVPFAVTMKVNILMQPTP